MTDTPALTHHQPNPTFTPFLSMLCPSFAIPLNVDCPTFSIPDLPLSMREGLSTPITPARMATPTLNRPPCAPLLLGAAITGEALLLLLLTLTAALNGVAVDGMTDAAVEGEELSAPASAAEGTAEDEEGISGRGPVRFHCCSHPLL